MQKLKKISLVCLVIFYLLAGFNHFRDPESYYKIIPRYIPFPVVANYIAGLCEIGFALLLITANTMRWGALGIILMLLAFLPVHIAMVSNAPLYLGSLKVTPFLAWIRLLVLQPLLILWVTVSVNWFKVDIVNS